MNSASVTGRARPIGSPSMSMPTRPSIRSIANRSGRSVCRSCGKGERGASTIYSSSVPVARRASTSSASSREASSRTVSGEATPSTNMMASFVCDLRPMLLSMTLRFGEQIRFRTSAVLVRRVSTKESFAPLMDFSRVGSDTERVLLVLTSKHTACAAPSNISAQKPCVRSSTTSSSVSRRFAE